MSRLTLIIFLFAVGLNCPAQDSQYISSLTGKINTAESDAAKITSLAELAEYYAALNMSSKSDSVLRKALMIADVSDDRGVVIKMLLNNSVTTFNSWSNQQTFQKGIDIIQNGLSYAQDTKNSSLEALAYIRLASIYRKRHLYDEAIQNTSKAVTALADTKNTDSVRIELFSELGDIYRAKSDPVTACKNYNNAFEIAYRQKDIKSQSVIYHRLSELYRSFNDKESAKKYLLESLRLNTANKNTEGRFRDFLGLAKITNERGYIEKAGLLAKNMHSPNYEMQAKRLMYFWYMVEGKKSKETMDFLYANPDLMQYFINAHPAGLTWEKGNIYKYGGIYDSALFFFRNAEAQLLTTDHPGRLLDVYGTMGETYLQNRDTINAKFYLEKTLSVAHKLNQVSKYAEVSTQLGEIAAKKSDFTMAYHYAIHADSANKIILANAAKDKIALLEIDRENKKREADTLEIANNISRKHNIQIMAITLLITAFFGFMLLVGMFEVSHTTIKIIGYFAFISLFEFIILILDHPIIAFTNGEPLKIWLIKIVVIAMLVPIQHFLEKRLIAYLESRELLKARQRFSLKTLFRGKTVINPAEEVIKDPTAVL